MQHSFLRALITFRHCYQTYPAIYVPVGHTLTIKGSGNLTADASSTFSAGIGGGASLSCGNIVIDGETVEAIGGNYSAGIVEGWRVNCGNIVIDGGTIIAKGGHFGAGIGGRHYGECGTSPKLQPLRERTHSTVSEQAICAAAAR